MADGLPVDGNVLTANVVLFGRMLRRAGLSVDTDQTRRFADVLALLGFDRRGDVKAAGRAVFVRRREQRVVYDAAFDLFWRRSTARGRVSAELPRLRQKEGPRADVSFGPEAPPGVDVTDVVAETTRLGASALEQLRTADFAELTPAEARDAAAMLALLRPRLALRPSRRRRLAGHGRRLAARAMLRRSLGACGGQGGGLERWHAHRRERARAEPPLGPSHHPQRRDRHDRIRWLGAGRSRPARPRDGDAGALVPPADLARPARGATWIRAEHAGAGGRTTVRGRLHRLFEPGIARDARQEAA